MTRLRVDRRRAPALWSEGPAIARVASLAETPPTTVTLTRDQLLALLPSRPTRGPLDSAEVQAFNSGEDNIISEIEAAINRLSAPVAEVPPAHPWAGRTVWVAAGRDAGAAFTVMDYWRNIDKSDWSDDDKATLYVDYTLRLLRHRPWLLSDAPNALYGTVDGLDCLFHPDELTVDPPEARS